MLGRPHKFDWDKAQSLFDEGKTLFEIAKELNVTLPAIKYAILKRDKKNGAVSTLLFEKSSQGVSRHLDTVSQLQYVNKNMIDLLDLMTKASTGDESAIALLNQDINFKRKDPNELRIKAAAEIKEQLILQQKIFDTLYTVQQVDEYQDEVEATMEEMEPGLRNRFLKRLKEKRLLHSAAQWKDK
ncbi:MAG: hypothetical protein V1740_03610 [Candidatus Woesearchaeota archaeon]